MSDNWIVIIPKNPLFRPRKSNFESALELLNQIAPEADEITIINTEKVSFFDCGSNFESTSCPSCNALVSQDAWHELMATDYENEGFLLRQYPMSCCGNLHNLNELNYYFSQGFSVFAIEIMNPNINQLEASALIKLESILGNEVRVIYQHI